MNDQGAHTVSGKKARSYGPLVGGREQRRLLALASKDRLVKILEKMLDENEFLSEHGIRS